MSVSEKKVILIYLILNLVGCNNKNIDELNKENTELRLKVQELEFKMAKLLSNLPNTKEIKGLKIYTN